ncbi:hypothetical protein AAGX49_15630, partial [Staphylococcus aureus]
RSCERGYFCERQNFCRNCVIIKLQVISQKGSLNDYPLFYVKIFIKPHARHNKNTPRTSSIVSTGYSRSVMQLRKGLSETNRKPNNKKDYAWSFRTSPYHMIKYFWRFSIMTEQIYLYF